MTSARPNLRSIALLTPGTFDDDHPVAGLEDTLDLFELGERLGFDGAWIRQRHLEQIVSDLAEKADSALGWQGATPVAA
ncbi:hypothetical protein AX769_16220 [Frondihabitans sp. PAMC 28766]|uniref:hypothetical protein n=1 Tax=Frondihabitans sp. PAMC 28766 TaxID=1795630 RepID=UPI00078CBCD8|nr:hypothetical protein [Frondihabitans sp. PAMC 28766]AMM21393.1 hypothetical protein AX769_16220 [Frondihabitans sp. PAMC 28766]